jgi:hypothetical protein
MTGWDELQSYKSLNQKLEQIREELAPIVLTDLGGSRGVDFKFKSVVQLVISLRHLTYASLKQSLGRGSRRADEFAVGTLVVRGAPRSQ